MVIFSSVGSSCYVVLLSLCLVYIGYSYMWMNSSLLVGSQWRHSFSIQTHSRKETDIPSWINLFVPTSTLIAIQWSFSFNGLSSKSHIFGQRASSYSSSVLWNAIPLSAVDAPIISTFKRRLKSLPREAYCQDKLSVCTSVALRYRDHILIV